MIYRTENKTEDYIPETMQRMEIARKKNVKEIELTAKITKEKEEKWVFYCSLKTCQFDKAGLSLCKALNSLVIFRLPKIFEKKKTPVF